LVEDHASIIKKGRESMGLSQKDFAGRISEKESTIHKIETGALEPSFQLAKKLEKILGAKLIEEFRESRNSFKRKKEEGFTLGDFIKVK
jgi:putative transcription factor